MTTAILLFPALLVLVGGVKLPPSFEKCSRDQADLDQCTLKAAQNGLTQLTKAHDQVNLPLGDPFELPELAIAASEKIGVNQTFTNLKIYGLSRMVLDKFQFDFDNKFLDYSGICPEIKLVGEYSMEGRLYVLPINGKGNCEITLENLTSAAHLPFEEYTRDSKTHLRFRYSPIGIEPSLVKFDFESSADKTVSNSINRVLNENWKEVFEDVKDGYVQALSRIVVSLLNGFFDAVSVDEALASG